MWWVLLRFLPQVTADLLWVLYYVSYGSYTGLTWIASKPQPTLAQLQARLLILEQLLQDQEEWVLISSCHDEPICKL